MKIKITLALVLSTVLATHGFAEEPASGEQAEAAGQKWFDDLDMNGLVIDQAFDKGVELASLEDGRLTVRVKTRFFALSGRNPNVLVPADAGAPKGSYFQIRQNIPGELKLSAPLTLP